ncbi:MAG: gliding motility-associated C-terminal domain-containing protein [Saprospiraceae bacterium]|nr:gliding motility-associated C-terminal domain-containing protein [Saprospiraceae bacterium]
MKIFRLLFFFVIYQSVLSAQVPAPELNCVRRDTLIWTTPLIRCGSINAYLIYAARNPQGPYQLLTTITNINQTRYFHNNTEGGTWYYYMQTDANCSGLARLSSDTLDNQPPSLNPILVVSVLSNTSVDIRWRRNASPEVVGYIVYKQTNTGLVPIANVPNRDTIHFVDNTATPSVKIETYQVLAVDACNNTSLFDQNHNTVLLKAVQSKCDQTITLKWNIYKNAATALSKHEIWVGENGRNPSLVASVGATDTTYTLRNVADKIHYNIFVRAVQSITNISSRSSDTTIIADIIQPVTTLLLKNASVTDKNQVEIVWFWNRNAKIDSVRILRGDKDSGYVEIKKFKAPSPLDNEYFFVDTSANPSLHSYFYKVETKDQCGVRRLSNFAMTPFLEGKGAANRRNLLTWNRLLVPIGEPTGYQVYRIVSGVPTPVGLPQDTSVFDFPDIVGTDEPTVCYKLGANLRYRLPDGSEEEGTSFSNTVCIDQFSTIWVPNAFAPSGKNVEFRPVFTYVGRVQDYKMEIFDRWGSKIFESIDPVLGWDGRRNGQDMPQGAYTYLIKASQANGHSFAERGIVMLLR